jgi:hypothetical protein
VIYDSSQSSALSTLKNDSTVASNNYNNRLMLTAIFYRFPCEVYGYVIICQPHCLPFDSPSIRCGAYGLSGVAGYRIAGKPHADFRLITPLAKRFVRFQLGTYGGAYYRLLYSITVEPLVNGTLEWHHPSLSDQHSSHAGSELRSDD